MKLILVKFSFLVCLFVLPFLGLTQENTKNNATSISPLFSENMIIQRGQEMLVWGKGIPEDVVTVRFQDMARSTKVKNDGTWELSLAEPKIGGPYTLEFNNEEYSNIYVGDVWMAGGQSNMGWKMLNTNGYESELESDDFPFIRYFKVPKAIHNVEKWDVSGGEWTVVDRNHLKDISGVAYFFAKKIYKETGVPIGIVDHSWGGSDIEGWLPYESFDKYPDWQIKADQFRSLEFDPEVENRKIQDWYTEMELADYGRKENWHELTDYSSEWDSISVPGKWEKQGFSNLDGIVYLSRKFKSPTNIQGNCTLSLGAIDDSDYSFINGQLIGNTIRSYAAKRVYSFSQDALQESNILTVRVTDYGGGGGFHSTSDELYITCGIDTVHLAGTWKLRVGTQNYPKKPVLMDVNSFPTNRYNAMMVPLFKFPMTGMIWYQGESNTCRPETYSDHFHSMIAHYREKWNQEFPFLFVQLANYKTESGSENSAWADLREAQASVLDMENIAMVTAIDIGEAEDIHPRNKKDVGGRLANAALNIEYNLDFPYKSPEIKSYVQQGSLIKVDFSNIEKGMKSSNPRDIPGFYIMDQSGEYKKVNARLIDDFVLIDIKDNQAKILFYAWSDNPGKLDLYNSENLPLLPFKLSISK